MKTVRPVPWVWAAIAATGSCGLAVAADGGEPLPHRSWQFQDIDRAYLLETIYGARGVTLLLLLLGIAVAPGVAEELLCRGLFQRALQRRYGGSVAVLGSAVIFGAIHLDLAQGMLAFVLGLYLGAMALATGSSRAGIFAHILNNAVATCIAAVGIASHTSNPIWLHGLAVVAALAGCGVLGRALRA